MTLRYPSTLHTTSEGKQQGSVLLPYAYQFDDEPGFENFYFITASSEIPVDQTCLQITSILKRSNWQLKLEDHFKLNLSPAE